MKNLTIQYINYWKDPFNDRWLLKFIKYHFGNKYNIIEVKNKKVCDILIASCYGNINLIKGINAKLKLFFYGENLTRERYKKYSNLNLLRNNFDLIVGFLPTDLENKVLRFPLWFMYYPFYDMNEGKNNIIDYIKNKRKENMKFEKKFFASCITRHNENNVRGLICDEFSKYGEVKYAGKFRKNINIGPKQIHKTNFLRNVKFNICPENSKWRGYHTEKIFQALESGCIPVYWGIDYAEKDIINKDCYLFTNIENQEELNREIKRGVENYENILEENIFTVNAKNVIKKYYNNLYMNIEKKLNTL